MNDKYYYFVVVKKGVLFYGNVSIFVLEHKTNCKYICFFFLIYGTFLILVSQYNVCCVVHALN